MTPEKLEAARQILLDLPSGEDPRDALYAHWFHETSESEESYPDPLAYHAASLHTDLFDLGWTVSRTGLAGRASQVEVRKAGRTRIVAPPDVTPEDDRALAFAKGMRVAVNPYATQEANGFWHLFSPRWQEAMAPVPRRRVYFAVERAQETAFLRAAVQAMDPEAQFAMKILTGRAPAGRCDPCVFYLPEEMAVEDGWVVDLCDRVSPFLGEIAVPGARVLRDGVAEAPDLDDAESFGQKVCGALASVSPDDENWSAKARAQLLKIGAQVP